MRRRFVQIDGVLHEVPTHWTPQPRVKTHEVMPDIKPYKSMLNGKMVESRSTHRELLRAHRCIEVGNELKHLYSKVKPIEPAPGLKETITGLANEKLRRI